MEQKFGVNSIDLQKLFDFCEREGKTVSYRKGEQMECEGEPSQWFGFVTKGCFKYVTQGISDDKEHITWFSFEGEYVGDYPVSGEQLTQLFNQNMESMELRTIIGEHLLNQARARYLDFHRATPRERYGLLLRRCPGIVEHLPLHAIASFLCVTPQQLSRIRKAVTFEE